MQPAAPIAKVLQRVWHCKLMPLRSFAPFLGRRGAGAAQSLSKLVCRYASLIIEGQLCQRELSLHGLQGFLAQRRIIIVAETLPRYLLAACLLQQA